MRSGTTPVVFSLMTATFLAVILLAAVLPGHTHAEINEIIGEGALFGLLAFAATTFLPPDHQLANKWRLAGIMVVVAAVSAAGAWITDPAQWESNLAVTFLPITVGLVTLTTARVFRNWNLEDTSDD